ncbi:MAG: type II toxin-antitoxin system VapC family toxin [Spirochaetes bacterium]|nr:type II toxin-antitoxin system VapC family toxin [Spirochaetota bacterium]
MITLVTCVIIWYALDKNKISKKALNVINKENKNNSVIISQISFWEIAMLIKLNRLIINADYEEFIDLILISNNYKIFGITPKIAQFAVSFDNSITKDPADRIISATSITENAPLITADKNLISSKLIKTIW